MFSPPVTVAGKAHFAWPLSAARNSMFAQPAGVAARADHNMVSSGRTRSHSQVPRTLVTSVSMLYFSSDRSKSSTLLNNSLKLPLPKPPHPARCSGCRPCASGASTMQPTRWMISKNCRGDEAER